MPDSLTMPIPPRPGAVAMATMVTMVRMMPMVVQQVMQTVMVQLQTTLILTQQQTSRREMVTSHILDKQGLCQVEEQTLIVMPL